MPAPMARQQLKEEIWRRKLSGERSLWDKSSALLTDTDPAATAAVDATDVTGRRLRTLVSGRREAQAEQKNIDEWKGSAIDDFLSRSDVSKAESKLTRRRRKAVQTRSQGSLPPMPPLPSLPPPGFVRTWPGPSLHGIGGLREGCEALSSGSPAKRPRLPLLRPVLDSRAELRRKVSNACAAMDRVSSVRCS